MAKTLRGTLSLWSRLLVGFDLHAEFIRATKARLVLMARSRGVFTDPLLERDLKDSFPGIVRKDALTKTAKVANQATLLMNPPYFAGPPRAKHEWWGVGQLNAAAEFVARYLEIIGFIQLHILGSQIRGDYWSTDAKRIVRTRTKRFKWRIHKLAPEMDLPRDGSNTEIFATIRQYVERCGHELKGRCIFTRDLEVLGPHVDWNGLLKDGTNYGPQRGFPGLTIPKDGRK